MPHAALVFLRFECREAFNCAAKIMICNAWREFLVIAEEDEIGTNVQNGDKIISGVSEDGMRRGVLLRNYPKAFLLRLTGTFPLDAYDGFIARNNDPRFPMLHRLLNHEPVTRVELIECPENQYTRHFTKSIRYTLFSSKT